MNTLNPLWVGLFWMLWGQVLPVCAAPSPVLDNHYPTASTALTEAIAPGSDAEASPTLEWMQQYLSGLAERYQCAETVAYQRLQVEKPATRYEMAALLFSCLERIQSHPLQAEDQPILQRLQTALKLELATLQGVGGGPEIWQQPILERVEDHSPDGLDSIGATLRFGHVELFGRYEQPSETLWVNASSGLPSEVSSPLPRTSAIPDRNVHLWSAGIGVRDVVIPNSRLAVTAQWSSQSELSPLSEVRYGAFYQFPLRDRLMLSPSVVIMTNPTDPRTPTIQGAVQASFSF